MSASKVFGKVLVANRGEIAVRVMRTLRDLGIGSVAVYSDSDVGARHVREAGDAIRIGPPPAVDSYLNISTIIDAALAVGAEAIHPGYGFLAENARFARACADAGLVFIGPPADAIEAMGDKIAAKATVAVAGVPVVPGVGRPGASDEELIEALDGRLFPVLVKPSAGGGGKGMRLVRSPGQLPGALASARREAKAAFGDDTLLVERYISCPRHIEIQVLADTHGTVVHLGERECSIQRRHQKIIEEAPSALLDPPHREAMGEAAVQAASSIGYTGVGTVEFVVSGDDPGQFYFMEMNTRLQVEHPVTELVYALDLVEWQLRVAAGEPLPFSATPPRNGHAVEARIYAEDPGRGFLPTGGTVLALREPTGTGIRVDSGLAEGMIVTSSYDPMLAKVIAWGRDRATALRRLDAALSETVVLGVTTNTAFLRKVVRDPEVQAGRLDTSLAERVAVQPIEATGHSANPRTEVARTDDIAADDVLAAAALARVLVREGDAVGGVGRGVIDPWEIPDGWRVGEGAWTTFRLRAGAGQVAVEVRVRGLASAGAAVAVGEADPVSGQAEFVAASAGGTDVVVTLAGRTARFAHAADGSTIWLGREGHAWAVTEDAVGTQRDGWAAGADGTVRAPMPGTVIAVHVSAGQPVRAGQALLVVEAMKMEHTVTAPADGTITRFTAKVGQQIGMDEQLAVIEQQQLTSHDELPTRRRARGTA